MPKFSSLAFIIAVAWTLSVEAFAQHWQWDFSIEYSSTYKSIYPNSWIFSISEEEHPLNSIKKMKFHRPPAVHSIIASSKDISPAPLYLYTLDIDGNLEKWDALSRQPIWKLPTNISARDFSIADLESGAIITVVGTRGRILLVGGDGKLLPSPYDRRISIDIMSVAMSDGAFSDFRTIAFGAANGKLYVCDFPLGTDCNAIRVSSIPLFKLRYVENNNALIVIDNVKTYFVNLLSGAVTNTYSLENETPGVSAFNLKTLDFIPPASVMLVAAEQDVYAFDFVQGKFLGQFSRPAYSDKIQSIKYLADRGKVITFTADQSLIAWDVFHGEVSSAISLFVPGLFFSLNSIVEMDDELKYIAIATTNITFGGDWLDSKLVFIEIPDGAI